MTHKTDSHFSASVCQPSPSLRKKTPKAKKNSSSHVWFEGPYNSVRGENALWVAVITQAMMDALSKSQNPEQLYHKREAIDWLTGNSKDFQLVCMFAGYEPSYVRRKAKKALVAPTAWRAAPGQGKRYRERKAYRERIKAQRSLEDTPAPPVIHSTPHKVSAVIIPGPWAA